MEYKDVFVADSEYEILVSMPGFCVFIGPNDQYYSKYDINTLVNLIVLPDYAFYYDLEEKLDEILFHKYYEISYLREVRIKNIHKKEWENHSGPQNAREFLEINKNYNHSTPIKVMYLKPIQADLKTLAKEYINPTQFGR